MIELVTAQNENVFAIVLVEIAKILSDSVGGTFVPFRAPLHGLLGGQKFDEAAIEIVEAVGLANVLVQRYAQKLGDNINSIDAAVETVADRDVDKTVFASQRDGRFSANFGKGKQPGSATTTQDQRNHLAHIIEHRNHLTF